MQPKELEVVIDVPRGSFIKRDDDGHIDYVSPLPCPFNYGSVPGTRSGDGDRPRRAGAGATGLARGARVVAPVVGLVEFVDAGQPDPKYICSHAPLRGRDKLLVELFFAGYAWFKGALNRLRRKRGATRYGGIIELPASP